jgi:hypothetical protein
MLHDKSQFSLHIVNRILLIHQDVLIVKERKNIVGC